MNEYIFFWKPRENNGYLCQWYNSPFITVSGLKFATAEQYMMYYKAITFNDYETASIIYNSPRAHPSVHKSLGRKVKEFDIKKWKKVCDNIVFEGNMYKFNQNAGIRNKLLETDDKVLAEASPKDSMWGIGYSDEDALNNIDNWGENRLGIVLMRVREQLKNNCIDAKYKRSKIYIGFAD